MTATTRTTGTTGPRIGNAEPLIVWVNGYTDKPGLCIRDMRGMCLQSDFGELGPWNVYDEQQKKRIMEVVMADDYHGAYRATGRKIREYYEFRKYPSVDIVLAYFRNLADLANLELRNFEEALATLDGQKKNGGEA